MGSPMTPFVYPFFPYSLTHHAIAWYGHLPRNSIHSFDDMMRKFLSKYFPPSMVTNLRNEITKFEQKPHELLFKDWERYKLSIDRCPNHNMLLVTQIDTFYNGLTLSHRDTINVAAGGTFMQKTPEECYETCGGPHSFTECPAISGYTQETAYATTGNYNSGGTGSLPSNSVPNPREDLNVITTRSGVTLAGPSVSSPSSSSKEVDREPMTITDQVLTGSTNNVPPLVVQPSLASTSFSTISSSKMPEVAKDMVHLTCEEYVQEVLGFFDNSKSGNPTPISDPIIALSSASLTPFEGGDFILEEIEACLTSESIPLGINDTDLDLEGDIRLLEELLNNDPSLSPLPPKEFIVEEIKIVKSSIDEPP
nr:reverse transcriptase domain-containing protein [Tanacetum cinerariifolium]